MAFGDKSEKQKAKEKADEKAALAKGQTEAKDWAETDKGNLSKASRQQAQAEAEAAKLARKQKLTEAQAADDEAIDTYAKKNTAKTGKSAKSKKDQEKDAQRKRLLMAYGGKPKAPPKDDLVLEVTDVLSDAEAFNIDAALNLFETTDATQKVGRKQAYLTYYDENVDRIKEEKPGLKKRQYDDLLFKEFSKEFKKMQAAEDQNK